MGLNWHRNPILRIFLNVAVLSLLLSANGAQAAAVHSCSKNGSKCIIKLQEGVVGDVVQVLDEKARIVGEGRIVKIKGTFGVIEVNPANSAIRRGYPVIVSVEKHESSLQWAATFSDEE